MLRITRYPFPEPAFAPVASTANILARWIGQENVSPRIVTLSPTFQAPAGGRQGCQISFIVHDHEDVGVLRIGFLCCQRTNEGKSRHAWIVARATDELQHFRQQDGSD